MERITEAIEKIANQVEANYNLIVSTGLTGSPSDGNQDKSSEVGSDTMDDDDLQFLEDEPDSPLNGMAQNVINDALSKHVGPQNVMEHIEAFKSAITWGEPFIIGLLCFHFVAFILAIMLSRSNNFGARISFLLFLGVVVRSAERLNEYGRENWESFATQDYFDKNGIFVTIMLSAPLLSICFFMMISYVREATRLMVEVKTFKLKEQNKRRKKESKKTK